MTTTSFLRPAVALALAALCGAAQADAFPLGTVRGPGTYSFEQIYRADPFEDTFTFTVASGTALTFSAFANTPYSNRFWIHDLDGTLERAGTTVLEASSVVDWTIGFPRTEVTFPTFALAAGDYTVRLTGTPTQFMPSFSVYDVAFTFGVAAPVPEPATALLATLGLVGVLGAARARPRR